MSDPMSDERLAEIEARYPSEEPHYEPGLIAMGMRATEDVLALVAEVRRLDAELAEAHTHFAIQEGRIREMADERDRALSSHPDEETVTSVEGLDALPVGSVVMEMTAEPFLGIPTVAGVFHKFPVAVQEPGRTPDEGWREWFVVAGHGARPAAEIILPARVLFRPTPEGSET